MAAIFTQVCGDPVAADRRHYLGGAHGIGMVPSARITDGGDVVDIDPETQPVAQAARLPGLVTGIAASSAGTSSSA